MCTAFSIYVACFKGSDTVLFFKVLDWIENHGEAFLSKHTGVGKSLHRARALQKRHEDFEEVAQVGFVFVFGKKKTALREEESLYVM